VGLVNTGSECAASFSHKTRIRKSVLVMVWKMLQLLVAFIVLSCLPDYWCRMGERVENFGQKFFITVFFNS